MIARGFLRHTQVLEGEDLLLEFARKQTGAYLRSAKLHEIRLKRALSRLSNTLKFGKSHFNHLFLSHEAKRHTKKLLVAKKKLPRPGIEPGLFWGQKSR